MTTTCVRCDRPAADGYACSPCASRASRQLAELADLCPAARDVAHGLSRSQNAAGGSGVPGPRFPINLAAAAKLDAVTNELTTWARHVADERRGATWVWMRDPVIEAALWLAGHVEWMRHRPEADEWLTDVDACVRVIRGIVRGPAEQRYLGPCGAPIVREPADEIGMLVTEECYGDVYGRVGAQLGHCRTCGAQVDQDERRAWLDDEVRQHVYRASEIASAYPIRSNTIRVWHFRGRLANHGHDPDGRPLFNVGEVLDLARADAARRETERAKRERRTARRKAPEAST